MPILMHICLALIFTLVSRGLFFGIIYIYFVLYHSLDDAWLSSVNI